MSEGLFTTIGDEPVEARIVAWVLGEASAFEAAELERLCAERPELMIFKRRMLALHGLLAEAENPQTDDAWKLSSDKRKSVDDIFGEKAPVRLDVVKEKRIRHSGRRAFLAIAACLVLTFIIAGLVAPAGMRQRKKSDVAEVRNNKLQRQLAHFDSSARSQRLETTLPKELIEGTPRPINVPNLEAPASGPAGSATWRSSGPVGEVAMIPETASSNFILPEPTDSFAEMKGLSAEGQKAAKERLDGASALRDARARVVPAEPANPSSFMAKAGAGTVTSGTSVPVPEAESASSLALGNSRGIVTGSGSGGGFGGGAPAETQTATSTIAGNRSGDGIVDKKSIDGILNESGRIAGEGVSVAEKKLEKESKAPVVGDMPVLGALFSNDEKSNLSGESFFAQNDELVGANTYSGGTTVSGGALGVGGSGGVAGNVPAPAAAPMQAAPVPTDANGPVGAVARQPRPARPVVTEEVRYKIDDSDKQPAPGTSDADYWDTSEALAKGKKAGTEYEIHTGYKSEYLFRGVDLGKDHDDGADKASNEKDLRLPKITTRSALAPDKAIETAKELRNSGNTDDAKKILESTLSENPANQEVRDEIAKLDDPARSNPALTHDHTRSQLLSEAEKSWESEVPEKQAKVDVGRDRMTLEEYNRYDLSSRLNPPGANPETWFGRTANEATKDHQKQSEQAEAKDTLAKAIRDQEDKVEERRKVLSTIVRTKGIIYKEGEGSKDEAREEAIKRGLDAQDYADAKSEYETDAALLERMKLKLADGLDADSLAKAVRDQEDKVEERRKVLSSIVRTKGIIYKGQDSFYNQEGVAEDQGARNALQVYHGVEQEKLQLESQVNSLLKYDSDQLMVYASGINLPDNIVPELYPKYQEAKRQLDAEKAKGLGNDHPAVKAKVEQTEAMKRQLDEGVVSLRATLQAQLDLASTRLKQVQAMKDQTRENAIKRGLDAQDYADARREFEKDQELLQQMKLKLMGVSIKPKPEPPKPDLAKLMEEIAASEEPYSTFSLNISDASFQVAQAALAKGERPDPAGVKVEQFYNAVDYGDPAPSAGEPVAVSIEQAAHPVIPGRNLVRIALKTAAAGRSASQPLRLTLLVDQSGSMVRADRRAAMDKALAGLSELLTENDLVTVIGFSRTPRLLADGMTGDNAGKLAALVNQAASEGGTNLEEAIKLGEQMADRRKLAGAQNRIVLLTDGAANLGNADPQRLALKVGQLRQKGIAFDIAGIAADGLNDELLGELARKGNGRYYVVGKGAEEDFAKQLAGAFRPAAENVKVQVRFNPERVSRYKLIGFEKDRLKTEDFRNDKVDAAELAAEEAGVAIYQVEPKPEGNGELGEVSVRFRDTANGEMVERTWTIPHDAAAPVIDRATPSMQLAVLAMLAGEKLKGGPLGDAIDFRQLAEPQANVKQFFGGNARVAEVLRMVEMLK